MAKLRHIGVIVKDIDESINFFKSIFDGQIYSRNTEGGKFIEELVGIDGAIVEWAKIKISDNTIIEVLNYHYPKKDELKLPQIGSSHIAFTVDDLEGLYNKIIEQGYHCNKLQTSPDNKVKVLYCFGPSGIVVELVEELK